MIKHLISKSQLVGETSNLHSYMFRLANKLALTGLFQTIVLNNIHHHDLKLLFLE